MKPIGGVGGVCKVSTNDFQPAGLLFVLRGGGWNWRWNCGWFGREGMEWNTAFVGRAAPRSH